MIVLEWFLEGECVLKVVLWVEKDEVERCVVVVEVSVIVRDAKIV